MKTAALLIGFGGPASPKEVRPFLQSVLQGVRVPPKRLEEVAGHYEALGGSSPYNAITFAQRDALGQWFRKNGADLPAFAAFRHAAPSFRDIFLELKHGRFEKVIGLILSPLRCYASYEKYIERVEEARRETAPDIRVEYVEPFYNNELFIDAQSERVWEVLRGIPPGDREKTFFLFSAHSIPVEMSDKSGYAAQFAAASSAIARRLGLTSWDIGYQSRSGDPKQPWLEPDVKTAVQKIDRNLFRHVLVVPAGFVSDNVEVLYDLDVELAEQAKRAGLDYHRALTVMDHPKFIQMMGEQMLSSLQGAAK